MKLSFKIIFLTILIFSEIISADEIENNLENKALDLDDFFDPYNQDFKDPSDVSFKSDLHCLTALDILQLITPEDGVPCNISPDVCPPDNCLINIPSILKQNLYKYTNGPVKRRSLLTEPSLRDYCLDHCLWHLVAHPFYNWTPRVPFINNSGFLESYIDLTNKNVVNEVMKAIEATGCSTSIDVPGILGLFKNIKLQQHRAGIMFAACTSISKLSLTLRIPLYYLAEHYYLSKTEIDFIKHAPYFENENQFPEDIYALDTVDKFGIENLISDRVGLGDTRFDALWSFYDNNKWGVWFGIAATIPTAITFASGLIGAKFYPCAKVPEFSLEKIFNLYLCPITDQGKREAGNIISEITTEFLVGAINRLSTVLFNAPLGNGGHFGIGPHLDIAYKLTNNWLFHTYGALEGFLKNYEYKFFLVKKTDSEFDRDYRNEERAEQNLLFLNKQIINTLYPTAIKINVNPVFNLRVAESIECDYVKWHGLIGLDYWYQAAEKYSCIKELSKRYNTAINIDKSAQQLKVFLYFGYRGVTPNDKIFCDITFTGDKAIWSNNIGEDLTVAFKVTLDF